MVVGVTIDAGRFIQDAVNTPKVNLDMIVSEGHNSPHHCASILACTHLLKGASDFVAQITTITMGCTR
jgi:hypothetical protein